MSEPAALSNIEPLDLFDGGDPFSPKMLDNVELVTIERSAKPKRKASPTVLSLAYLRKAGCVAAVVEKWNPHAKVRQDLFGVIDVVALSPDGVTIGVQATSRDNVAARVNKIGDAESVVALRRCNWRLIVHGWDKDPKTGRYRVREVDVS